MAKHYYISFNGTDFTEIFPVNNPEAVQTQLEGTRVWRESVDELRLPQTNNSAVYTTLHSYFIDKTNFDTEIEIEIYTGTRATGSIYWKGLFSISDTDDNFQNTVAVLNPLRINDDYRTILEQSERQIEIEIGTILKHRRVGYSEPLTIGPAWTNPAAGYNALNTLNASAGSVLTAIATNDASQDAASVGLPALANNDIVIIDVAGWTLNAGVRIPLFDIEYGGGSASMTDEGSKNIATGLMGYTISTGQASPRLVLHSPPAPAGTFDIRNLTFTARKIAADNDHTSSGRLLMTFLNIFISSATYMGVAALDGNVVSTFFDNDALPTGAPSTIATFMGANANGNYVTGTSTNELNTTIIGLLRQWFDVSEPASFKLSFNDIMGQLREMFQVYWFMDADGKFRVEHEMYFVRQVDDSTPIDLSNYPTSEVDAREFKYNKGRLASTETFQWAQSHNEDFVGNDIIYNNFETIDNSKDHSLNYITTDIKYVIDNLEEASNNGLGLYQCNILTGITGVDIYEINISTGELSAAAISNAAFSWANLHDKYWSWSRMAEDATVNGGAETMDSSIRFLEQDNVRFFYSTAIDPFTLITATLTGGAPIEIKRDLETDYVQIILGFDPYKL